MAVTLTPHQRALLQLLPDGLAWDKRPSSVLAALCLGLSHSTERVSWTGNQMLAERFLIHPVCCWKTGSVIWGYRM